MNSTSIIGKCHCKPVEHLHFIDRQAKKEEFCLGLLLEMKSGSISIIPNLENHEWTQINHQHLRDAIFTMLGICWNQEGVLGMSC